MRTLSHLEMPRWALAGALILSGIGAVATARAQINDVTPVPPLLAQPREPSDQSPSSNPPGQPSIPPGTTLGGALSESKGVIPPPRTGDRNALPPPNADVSRTPVIPPPGSPGGNPNIQPK